MKRLLISSILFISISIYGQVPTNGLVGYWPFNGGASDESYNGLNGICESITDTTNRFNIPTSAFYFNGIDSRVLVSDTSALDLAGNSITISAWVKPLSKTIQYHHAAILGKGGWNYNAGYELLLDHSNRVEFTIGRTTVTTDDSLLLGVYTHIVATFDDNLNISKIYLNGIEKKAGIVNNSIEATNSPLSIGKRCDGNDYIAAIKGFIDDVCIYNRVLSDAEINDLYLYQDKIYYTTVTVTDTLFINVNLVNLNPVSYENTIKVFPNPTKNNITIDCGANFNQLNNYEIKITNSSGQIVYKSLINQQSQTLNLNNWTGKGLYLIYLLKDEIIVDVRKIILQ